MSETKLPDILELGRRWQKAWTSNRKDAGNAIGNSFGLLCDEITRLRSHAGWHEEALRKWLELEAAYDRSTGAVATAKAAKAIQDHRAMVSALLPPGGEKG